MKISRQFIMKYMINPLVIGAISINIINIIMLSLFRIRNVQLFLLFELIGILVYDWLTKRYRSNQ